MVVSSLDNVSDVEKILPVTMLAAEWKSRHNMMGFHSYTAALAVARCIGEGGDQMLVTEHSTGNQIALP